MRPVRLSCVALALAVLGGCTSAAGGGHGSSDPPESARQLRTRAIRVTVAGGCPASLDAAADVRNDPSGLTARLVPAGDQPDSALICRYPGMATADGLPSPKNRRIVLRRAAADALARALAQVSLVQPKGMFSCPADFESLAIIVLHYAAGSGVDIWYRTTGCQTLDNGYVLAFEGANPSFYNTFVDAYARLVPG
jgi:hypothetical protein